MPKTVRDIWLERARNAYVETSNPLFVWQAIDYCSDRWFGARTEIPAWCAEYLFKSAEALMALVRPEGHPCKQQDAAAAFGLAGQGKNDFRKAAADLRKMQLAEKYYLNRATGRSAADALDEAKREAGLECSGDRSAFAAIAKGVRLMGEQVPQKLRVRKPPGKF
jgi:hypothetical protein